jgi:hypothetical protein
MNLYPNRRLEYNRLIISMLKKSVVNIILNIFEATKLIFATKNGEKTLKNPTLSF